MMNKTRYYFYIFSLLFGLSLLSSCVYDVVDPNEPDIPASALDDYEDKFTLNLAITLDAMGNETEYENPMYEIENYIDPEKLRILFFDHEDKFLFESKSRRVKKLGGAHDYSEWLVSVPFYDSGNDKGYNWKWDDIRDSITNHKFKIAVLANRPLIECYPDLAEKNEDNRGSKNFDNRGPFWDASDMGKKRVFDLHHSQWDPIYTDKGKRAGGAIEGYYEFIMGTNPNISSYDSRLMMSSTSCWVNHGPTYTDDGPKDASESSNGTSNLRRYNIIPTQDYPIPMYGIQEFEPVTNWVKGTPFNLSDLSHGGNKEYEFRAVSMLRSVVKLELMIPMTESKPTYVGHRYPNIYARCEPMDVWTPTDKIWSEDHDNGCEWINIYNYGAISRKGDDTGGLQATSATNPQDAKSFEEYRDRISWFYGAWLDPYADGTPRWTFGNFGVERVKSNITSQGDDMPSPRIYNPCIQRNAATVCSPDNDMTSKYADGYYHYVVYTGERNMNDPSDLFTLGTAKEGGGGKAPTISWMFEIDGTMYNLPIGPTCGDHFESGTVIRGNKFEDLTYQYHMDVWGSPKDKDILPWPLVRNHVYRIYVEKTKADGSVSYRSSMKSSPSIRHY